MRIGIAGLQKNQFSKVCDRVTGDIDLVEILDGDGRRLPEVDWILASKFVNHKSTKRFTKAVGSRQVCFGLGVSRMASKIGEIAER